jgi:hypothetical protein
VTSLQLFLEYFMIGGKKTAILRLKLAHNACHFLDQGCFSSFPFLLIAGRHDAVEKPPSCPATMCPVLNPGEIKTRKEAALFPVHQIILFSENCDLRKI